MTLRLLFPFVDSSVRHWSIEARLLRWLTFLWLFMGLVVLFSASYPNGDTTYGDGLYYFKRQLIAVVLGLFAFNWLVRSPLHRIQGIAAGCVILFLSLIFLTLVPGFGKTVLGSTRWLSLGPIALQPSELIKPFLVLQGARVFGNWNRLKWKVRFTWLGIFCSVLLGILLQPNLSTTALCGMTLWLIALASGLQFSYLGGTAVGGILLATLSVTFKEYQRRRILSFLNPWDDPQNTGYQLVQSLLAVGSGGTWGAGYGMSQQKLSYLPIEYTDFIFSVFAEEFGFAGSVLLLLLLISYGTLGLIVATKAKSMVPRLIAIGATILMVGQSLLNIGVATGALPTTGLPLPLFSYGGNSVIASLVAAGLLIRVAREGSEAEVVSLEKRRSARSKRERFR